MSKRFVKMKRKVSSLRQNLRTVRQTVKDLQTEVIVLKPQAWSQGEDNYWSEHTEISFKKSREKGKETETATKDKEKQTKENEDSEEEEREVDSEEEEGEDVDTESEKEMETEPEGQEGTKIEGTGKEGTKQEAEQGTCEEEIDKEGKGEEEVTKMKTKAEGQEEKTETEQQGEGEKLGVVVFHRNLIKEKLMSIVGLAPTEETVVENEEDVVEEEAVHTKLTKQRGRWKRVMQMNLAKRRSPKEKRVIEPSHFKRDPYTTTGKGKNKAGAEADVGKKDKAKAVKGKKGRIELREESQEIQDREQT